MQVRFLNRKIRRLQQDIEDLESKATGTGSHEMSADRVQTSRNLEGFSKYVLDAIVKKDELKDTILKLDEKKQEVIDVIEQVSNPDIYEVLYMYYIQEFNWTQISEQMHFAYSWIHELKCRGWEKVQQIIDNNG